MESLDRFKDTYITECYELLADMEELLLNLENSENSLDSLNAIFRCAHSIKGGAGAFGYTQITKFTHVLETLLDLLRSSKLEVSKDVVDTLLKSADIVLEFVGAAKNNTKLPDSFGDEIKAELEKYCDGNLTQAPAVQVQAKPNPDEPILVEINIYRIEFKPDVDLFKTGNEPLLLIKELASIGILQTMLNYRILPNLKNLNPEDCYFSWVFDLESKCDEARIKEVFEFVIDCCELVIERVAGFVIQEMPKPIETSTAKKVVYVAPTEYSENTEQLLNKQPANTNSDTKTQVTSIRVDIDKVDNLVNMVGELVITQSMIYAQTKKLAADLYPELIKGVDELSQHTRELQEAVMSVRMQPVKSVFSRMPRIVRDLSKALGKEIKLETYGENTEVDKTVIEQLCDPLTHMIRNSCDHGVETPEERIAKNKNPEGIIKLSASNHGGKIMIEIRDDGKGLDTDRILEKAIEKKLIAPDAKLTQKDIINLLFLPGFSTAKVVSNVSGRGVGMDVVRRNIQALGGSIDIQSVKDEGLIFTVLLPLTLAILDGMIVRVGEENYIIPIVNIIETLRPKLGEIKRVSKGSYVLNVRGEYISILRLSHLFNIENSEMDPAKALIILVENGQNKFGLMVDELVGQQQVVIKSLEENSDPVAGISGATILGSGKVSLILDIAKLQNITADISSELEESNQKEAS